MQIIFYYALILLSLVLIGTYGQVLVTLTGGY